MRGSPARHFGSRSIAGLLALALVMALLTLNVSAESLKYWSYLDDSSPMGRSLARIIAAFEKDNPDVKVEVEVPTGNYREYHEKLRVAIAAGNAPDLAFFERSYIGDWVATQRPFASLDNVLDPNNRMSAFLPGTAGEVVHHGQVWGIPHSTAMRALLWNTTLLNEAGLDSVNGPRSMDELATYAKRLTKEDGNGQLRQLGYVPWINGWNAPGYFWTFGGDVYDEDGYPSLNAPRNVEALRWMQEWAQRYPPVLVSAFLTANGGNSWKAFAEEKLAMYAQSSNILARLRDMSPDLTLNVGVHPYPAGGGNGGWMGGFAHVVPRSAEMTSGLKRLVNFIAGARAQLMFYEDSLALPTRKDAIATVADRIRTSDPIMAKYLDQANTQHGRPPFWGVVIRYANGAQNKVINMEATPEAALEEAQQGLVSYLKDNGVLK